MCVFDRTSCCSLDIWWNRWRKETVSHFCVRYVVHSTFSRHNIYSLFFFQINFCFTCVNFPPWKAGVCECVFLVYTTESEREGRKYRLPEKTGSGKLGFWRIQRQEPSTWLCVFISKVAPAIKERMMKQGTMMLGYQPLGNRVNFFRVVVLSPLVCQKDMDWFLDEIERLGKDLWLKSWITDHCQCSQWRHLTYWLYRLIITCKRSFLK